MSKKNIKQELGFIECQRLSIDKGSITQGTSITTGVTLNKPAGIITTVSTTLATRGNTSFTVTNNYVSSDTLVLASILNYSGSNGQPTVRANTVTDGSFNITLSNADDISALNGAVKIGYTLL